MEAVAEPIHIRKYEAYRCSGAKWIGEIPEHWATLRLKFICAISKGKMPKRLVDDGSNDLPVYLSMDYLRGGIPNQWVLDKDVKVIRSDEILLLWDGANAGEFLKSKQGVISSTIASIQFNGIHQQFAWYYTKVLETELRRTTVGMGIPHVSSDVLGTLLVALPPVDEQVTIANFLDYKISQMDKAIAQKEALIERLKERRQILIHRAVTCGLNPHVRMKDSGVKWIGEVPEHWRVATNTSLFTERKQPGNELLPILSVSIHTAVSTGQLQEDENVQGRVRIQDKSSYKLVCPNDIVYNMMRAWQGGIGVVRVAGMVSPAYIVARPSKVLNGEYFEYLYRTSDFVQQMDRYSKGITDFRKRLYWNEFKRLFALVPSRQEQDEIVCFIKNSTIKTNKIIEHNSDQISKLREYKSTLINAAVTGKIKVC